MFVRLGGKVCVVCVWGVRGVYGREYVKCAREVCGMWGMGDECVGSTECWEMCGT